MEKLNDTIILRVSKADRERIREKMDELASFTAVFREENQA